MLQTISFVLDGKIETIDFSKNYNPTTTVLNYLRSMPTHKGVKEGCAEGDCGACTIVVGELTHDDKIRYKAIDSCLLFLPMIHGKQLITVENLSRTKGVADILHPVQKAMVDCNGSQCGYCTPGIIMSMFSLYKNENKKMNKSELIKEYKKSKKRFKNQLSFIKRGLKVEQVKTLKSAILRKIEKK